MEDGGTGGLVAETQAAVTVRVRSLQPDGPLIRCGTDAGQIVMPRQAYYLRAGDDVRLASLSWPIREVSVTMRDATRS